MIKLFEPAPEEGSYPIAFTLRDFNGNTLIPDFINWTLTDKKGNIINSREEVSITAAEDSIILVQGDDLKIGHYGIDRFVLVKYAYTSTLGNGIPDNEQIFFQIEDHRGTN